MKHIAIHGAAGRMGRRLAALTLQDPELVLAAALDSPDSGFLGQDAGILAGQAAAGLQLGQDLPDDRQVDVVIDFSAPAATRTILETCRRRRIALVIGTTGLGDPEHQAIDEAASSIAVLQAPNMSLGVNLLFALAARVAATLGDDYDIEITEAHHRQKKDAPSGTALQLVRAICDATGRDLEHDVVHGRCGDDVPRTRGEVGMHVLRMGDVVGEHTAHFATEGERVVLSHVATTRDVFARGALRAAKWLADQEPGRYQMAQVLGL